MAKYSYDPECERLAEHFLQDEHGEMSEPDAARLRDMAQAIQDAVESFLYVPEPPKPVHGFDDDLKF